MHVHRGSLPHAQELKYAGERLTSPYTKAPANLVVGNTSGTGADSGSTVACASSTGVM